MIVPQTALADAAAGPLAAIGTRNSKRRAPEEIPAGNIRVAVRVRPLPQTEEGIIEVEDEGVILIHKQAATGGNQFLSSQQGRTEQRAFDHVFGPQANQAEVYEQVCAPLIWPVVADGRNATVFVYGATGAGKTHTMFGEKEEDSQGIIYRAIKDLFRALDQREQMGLQPKLSCRVSLMELYNETVRDLLGAGEGCVDKICRVLEDEKKGVVKVSNLMEVHVQSADEALRILKTGMNARKVEATAANSRSSRSHAMLSLTLESGERAARKPGMLKSEQAEVFKVHSRLCLIDLAGSERANATLNVGTALKDGAKINQSLLALANCIDALSAGSSTQPPKVAGTVQTPRKKPPYRDSKLTLLLKCSLSGDGLVSMVANVHPGKTHFEDSNNTLEYAKRASAVKVQTVIRPTRLSICEAPASPCRSPEKDKENVFHFQGKENRCSSQEFKCPSPQRSPSRLRQPKFRRPLHSRSSSNLPELVKQLERQASKPAQKKRALEQPSCPITTRGRVAVRTGSPEVSSGRRSLSEPPSETFETALLASPFDDARDEHWSPLNLSNVYDDETSAQDRIMAPHRNRSRPLSTATFLSVQEDTDPAVTMLAELVQSLNSEKAALAEQLETSYRERRSLEERVITLGKENSSKDKQLALLAKQLALLKS